MSHPAHTTHALSLSGRRTCLTACSHWRHLFSRGKELACPTRVGGVSPAGSEVANCSRPGRLMTSLPKALTRAASYLIVRCISIISVSAEPVYAGRLLLAGSRRLSVITNDVPSNMTIFRHNQRHLTLIQLGNLNMPCQTLSIYCAIMAEII